MKHTMQPSETLNALLAEPSVAFGLEGRPDVAIIDIRTQSQDWAVGLDAVVRGSMVLGFRILVLNLEKVGISSSFEIGCIVSSWQMLIDCEGTLCICGLSEKALAELQELTDLGQFNLFRELDTCIEWLISTFPTELERNFPRTAKCTECSTVGEVSKRGEHVCDNCGITYLVTERGELLF